MAYYLPMANHQQPHLISLPTGTVTFLFTDIEGSTKLSQQFAAKMPALLDRHNTILDQAINRYNGFTFQIVGDSYAVAFHNAIDALNAAVEMQQALLDEPWTPAPVKVRMGLHTGAAELQDSSPTRGYTGYTTLATTQRVMSAGHGGQILLSQVTADLIRNQLPDSTQLIDLHEQLLKDIVYPVRLFQVNAPGLPLEFPPLKTIEVVRHNLPGRLIPFVGREKDISDLFELVIQNRLVTLTGVGGIGKTNLSLQAGRKLLNPFTDGVWFIEFDPIADPKLVAQTAAHILGLRSVSDVPILKVMLDYLKEKSCLLILDNCEHLIEAAAELGQAILQACPSVKILATSREPLGITGEMVFQVLPLTVPTGKEQVTLEDWPKYEAMRLFVDRATAVLPQFQVTPENIAPLVQICQRLDGIPLALELAAARVKVLTTAQIAARLDDRFRFLTGGSRTALPRQQTLRALIDWSWELLSPDEKRLFERLSVFVGGMNLEAVEAVCTGEGLDRFDILDLLSELVNKSLVVALREPGQETWYRLLETIRQYAQEKLAQAGQLVAFRQHHLQYFLGLGQQAEPALVGPDQAAWIKRLEKEFDNIRAALDWALEVDVEAGLRLASYLYRFWDTVNFKEGVSWLAQLLTGAESIAPEIKAKALWVRGMLAYNVSGAGTVHQLAEECLALYQHLGDQRGIANSLLLLGMVISWDEGSDPHEHTYFQESLALFEALDDPLGKAEVLLWWGHAEAALFNNLTYAIQLEKESERLFRELGHWEGVSDALGIAALIANWQENYAQARRMLEECLSIQERLGRNGPPLNIMILGRLHFWLGDYAQAQMYFESSLEISQKIGENSGVFWAFTMLGFVFLRRNELSQAQAVFSKSLQLLEETGILVATGVAFALEGFANLALSRKDAERATRLIAWADATREARHNVRPINEQKDVERDIAAIREMIDEATFNTAYAEGKAMTVEEAIAYALQPEA